MLKNFLNYETKTIGSGARILALSFLVSRILGILRDRLLLGRFGAGEELDVYFAAFKIPDLIYGIFILGGINAVFLPLFAEYFQKQRDQAWRFAINFFNLLAVSLGFIALVLAFFTPELIKVIAPGFSSFQKELGANLMRLFLLSPFFFGLSSIVSSLLQYFEKFAIFALAPIVYNLAIIAGILFLAPFFGVLGVGYGVVLGAFLHFLIQFFPAKKAGFNWHFFIDAKDFAVKGALNLLLPRTIGGAAYHLNLLIMTTLASTLSVGTITILNIADTLQHFPVGLVGIPLALASFPAFSKAVARKEKALFFSLLSSTILRILFLIVPVALLLFFFREPLISFLFHTGAFGISDAKLTASVFGIFAFGIIFQSFIPLFVRAFFSLQDTKTPTFIGVGVVGLNILLILFFLQKNWGIFAFPWALLISGAIQCVLLGVFLIFTAKKQFPKTQEE